MPVPKVCRLCMSADTLVSIFVDNSFNSDDIFQATGVQVKANDGLPQKICTKCSQDLKHILDFREKCKDTENELLSLDNRSDSETDNSDSTVDKDIKKEPMDEEDGDVRSGINIEFENTDSESEDEVTSKEFNKQTACKICQRHIFKRRLKLHMAQRHPELDKMKVKCDLCIEYVNKLYMSKHLLLMHKNGFICIYCKENCHTREGIIKHLETCSETCRRPVLYSRELVACNVCHIFLTRSQLYKHKKIEHINQSAVYQHHPCQQNVICDICELKFFTIQGVNKHKQKHYTNEFFEITSIDHAMPLKTKKDIQREKVRNTGAKGSRSPKISDVSKVLIESLRVAKENALAQWLIQMQARQFVLDKISIFKSVEKIIGDQGVPQSHIISWINDFLDKRPEIEIRETKKLEDVYCNINIQVREWFGKMKGYLVKNNLREIMDDPKRVFSSDERLFFTTTYENKYGLVQDKSHNVLFTANAAGVLAPPMIVFAYKEVPDEIMGKIPDKWAVRRSDNGIMCCDNFYEYVRDVFNPWLEEAGIKKPVILFLNAHTSLLTLQLCDFCFQNGVELIALYPYSNEIAPMELALFKPMDTMWQKALIKNKGGFPEIKHLAPLLKDVVSITPISVIKKGFFKAGLFPMDFNNINIPKYATVKRYDYFRNAGNFPRNEIKERPQVKGETREIDCPKVGKVSKVYLSKKQLLERKEKEEKGVKIKEEQESHESDEVINSNKERKAVKRKTKEKLKFESSEESE